MKHFKHPTTGQVFAYETDEERKQWGDPELLEMTYSEVVAHLNPPLTLEQVQEQFTTAIQQRLDAFAKTRGYDGILSACTYASDPDPQLQAEGQFCVTVRSATWRAGYAILAAVQGGRPVPTVADVMAELPVLEWPQ